MFEKREYQTKGLAQIKTGLREHRRVLFSMATGGGKTVMFNQVTDIYRQHHRRVLMLMHRKELLTQAQEKLYRGHQIPSCIIQGKRPIRYDMPVFIGSVATLANRLDSGKLPPNIDLLITDEAHHALADTYQRVYEHYNRAQHLGVTATPWRLSGKGFEGTYNKLIEGPQVIDLERLGFLCKAKQFIVPMDRTSFDRLVNLSSTGDYNQKQLARYMGSDKMIQVLVSAYRNYSEGKQTVAYLTSVEQSQKFCNALRAIGVAAVHVDGKTKQDVRDAYIKGFASGRFKVLCNVGVATEGLDVPGIECVLLGRPTTSLSLYLQMCGRGSRLFDGKDHYNLIDVADNILYHGHPNKRQQWTLGDYDKKLYHKRTRYFRVRFPDDTMKEMSWSEIPSIPGLKVIEIDAPERYQLIDRLLVWAYTKRYKRGKVYYEFIRIANQEGQPPTIKEVDYMAKKLGYGGGWAHYTKKSLGLI